MFAIAGIHVNPDATPFMTGTFGQLFKAKDARTGRSCVMKVVNRAAAQKVDPHLNPEEECVINYLLARGHHPHIVECWGFTHNNKYICMLFEYATEGDMFDYIGTEGRTLPFVLTHGFAVASGLAFCHQNSIIHRDVKPENLLLFNNGPDRPPRVKICDFGLAVNVYHTKGRARGVCGTLEFMAPEVLLSDHLPHGYTAAVDSWSLGMVLYHMATAEFPFGEPGETREKQNKIISGCLQNPGFCYDFDKIENLQLRALVAQLIVFAPKDRLTMSQICHHPIFRTPFFYNPADFQRPAPSSPNLHHSSFLGI